MSLEIALAGMSVVQGAAGGEGWTADQVSYPDSLERVDPSLGLTALTVPFAVFEYDINQIFGEDYTRALITFSLVGEFSYNSDEATAKNRIMANCYVQLTDWEADTRFFDHFSMNATVMPTPIGPAEDPKIRWRAQGRFDPASFGDVNYDVTMDLDQFGRLTVTGSPVLDNNGWFSTATYVATDSGFHLLLRQS